MPKWCSIGSCNHHHLMRNGKYGQKYRFFSFPSASKQLDRRMMWANACMRLDPITQKPWQPKDHVRGVYVCSDHFETGQPVHGWIHPDYVPHLNIEVQPAPSTSTKSPHQIDNNSSLGRSRHRKVRATSNNSVKRDSTICFAAPAVTHAASPHAASHAASPHAASPVSAPATTPVMGRKVNDPAHVDVTPSVFPLTTPATEQHKLRKETSVCSAHFKKDDYVFRGHTTQKRLQDTAVPTVFEWTNGSAPTQRKGSRKRLRDAVPVSAWTNDAPPVEDGHSHEQPSGQATSGPGVAPSLPQLPCEPPPAPSFDLSSHPRPMRLHKHSTRGSSEDTSCSSITASIVTKALHGTLPRPDSHDAGAFIKTELVDVGDVVQPALSDVDVLRKAEVKAEIQDEEDGDEVCLWELHDGQLIRIIAPR